MTRLPISLRGIKPFDDAVLVKGKSPITGFPDGIHTGGVYLYDGMCYKPLDGRPYVGCEYLIPTCEVECLTAALSHNIPLFPKNWYTEERNGRNWLVRKRALIVGTDIPVSELDNDIILQVERSLWRLNNVGWSINDDIVLAFDISEHEYFILDLSNAYNSGDHANDRHYRDRFLQFANPRLAKLRYNGERSKRDNIIMKLTELRKGDERYSERQRLENLWEETKGKSWVYASFNRPLSKLWASLPAESCIINPDQENYDELIPYSWLLCAEPLPDKTVSSYELVLASFPWRNPK